MACPYIFRDATGDPMARPYIFRDATGDPVARPYGSRSRLVYPWSTPLSPPISMGGSSPK